jgi:hypothetical protein
MRQPPLLLRLVLLTTAVASAVRFPRLIEQHLQKNKYTPLVFFKVPPGLIAECDEMEATVCQVEKELGVRVERLDILRDPTAEAALTLLTQRTPPFLYHRESCQVVHVPRENKDGKRPVVNKERVRAWAKGRYLAPLVNAAAAVDKVKTPVVLQQDDQSIDQDELLDDLSLTPLQKKGKEAMKERTK